MHYECHPVQADFFDNAPMRFNNALLNVDEHFFRLEEGRRFSFYVTGHSQPLAHALAEDYLLDEFAPKKTRFTYTVAMEPRLPVRMGGPLSRAYFGSMFRNACQGLSRYVAGER